MPDFGLDKALLQKLALITGNFLGDTDTQTATNKTINASNNTINDTSIAAGDILYSSGTTKFSRLARGSAYQNLRTNPAGSSVEWGDPPIFPSAGRMYGAKVGFGTTSTTNGVGLLQNVVQGLNATAAVSNTTSADGNCVTHTTGTANTKARAGWWASTLCYTMRKFNPTFIVRFRLGVAQTSSQGIFYVGLVNQNAQPAAGTSVLDTYLNSKIGVLFGFRAADTTFMIMSNNNQAAATYTTAGTPNSSATDANVHTLSISLNDTTPAINWSFDGAAMTSITDTTNCVPPQTTAIYPILILEAQTATGLTLIERWDQIYMDAI
jgi:hypothetical protein